MYSFLSNSSPVLNTHLILFARTENMSLSREKSPSDSSQQRLSISSCHLSLQP